VLRTIGKKQIANAIMMFGLMAFLRLPLFKRLRHLDMGYNHFTRRGAIAHAQSWYIQYHFDGGWSAAKTGKTFVRGAIEGTAGENVIKLKERTDPLHMR
jgi:hypothetical protein